MSIVVVSSMEQAPRMARKFRAQQVITMLDPKMVDQVPEFPGIEHLVLLFEDSASTKNIHAPIFNDVRQAFQFAHHNSNLVCHCHAGMSRSPSMAIGLLISRGLTPQDATRQVLSQNHYGKEGSYMEPNILMLAHIDRFLGLGNTLIGIVAQQAYRF